MPYFIAIAKTLSYVPGYVLVCLFPLALNDFTPTVSARCDGIVWQQAATTPDVESTPNPPPTSPFN